MNLVDPLVSAGLINLALFAFAAALAIARDRRWAWLCLLSALAFVTFASIVVQHRTEGDVERFAVIVEQLGWAAGPALYAFVRSAIGLRPTLRAIAPHFAPPVTVVIASTYLIAVRHWEPIPARLLVAYLLVYTAASAIRFAQRPDKGDRTPLGFWWPLAIISAMAAIHLGQVIRLVAPAGRYSDAVPVFASASVLLMVLGVMLLVHRAARTRGKYAKSTMRIDEAQALYRAVRRMLEDGKLFARPDLALGEVAEALDVSVHRLSQALSEGGRTSFSELLGVLRFEEARRRLLDPRNALVAVEPIGMEAGFRSRSAFYASFRKHAGMAPAEFRTRAAQSCPPQSAGTG